eukprot:310436-Chlamydomonas_euryale.AAC.1
MGCSHPGAGGRGGRLRWAQWLSQNAANRTPVELRLRLPGGANVQSPCSRRILGCTLALQQCLKLAKTCKSNEILPIKRMKLWLGIASGVGGPARRTCKEHAS